MILLYPDVWIPTSKIATCPDVSSVNAFLYVEKIPISCSERTLRNDLYVLWLRRLAHVSERDLQALSQKGLLGVNVELPFCEHCIMGKSTGVKFGRGKHTTKDILDYIHLDL